MKNALSCLLAGGVFALALASAGCASTTPQPASASAADTTSTPPGVANSQPPPSDDFVFVEKDSKPSAAKDDAPATDIHPTDMAARPKSH
jgi:hypothetical protein